MFQTISNFMRVRDIRNKIIFTLLVLIVFRLGTFIPVPNVDATALQQSDQQFNWLSEYIWWWCTGKLLHFSNGNYAVHHSFHHHAIIADGCRTEIYRVGESKGTLEDGNLHSSQGTSQLYLPLFKRLRCHSDLIKCMVERL